MKLETPQTGRFERVEIKKKNVDLSLRRSKLFGKKREKMEQQQTILCSNSKKKSNCSAASRKL